MDFVEAAGTSGLKLFLSRVHSNIFLAGHAVFCPRHHLQAAWWNCLIAAGTNAVFAFTQPIERRVQEPEFFVFEVIQAKRDKFIVRNLRLIFFAKPAAT